MDFFDLVPDNFFSLLSSKNKKIYLASIINVFNVYETGAILGIDKKVVVDDLVIFLEKNTEYLYDVEDLDDEEASPKNKKELANYILRRMEECGWIYVDVTNDYEEILNFSDAAITICEAILKIYPQMSYFYDDETTFEDYINPIEYQGYIYQIYSLLNQENIYDYSLVFDLVYTNTIHLIRAIRKLDVRMKDYIQSVIDNTEIKDLMEKLTIYQNEIFEKSYVKLKVSDNIDRYRLSIVEKLESFQNDSNIVDNISNLYLNRCKSKTDAINKAIKNIDEVIDAFNALEEFIAEIDNKNRNYINSTIGKVKFLLTEDDNIIGKLNSILKHVKEENVKGKIDKAMHLVDSMYRLPSVKLIDSESSLYTPRGGYQKNENQVLDTSTLVDFKLDDEFLSQFRTSYNERNIEAFMDLHFINDMIKASDIINLDCDDSLFIMMVYSIIYSADKGYKIDILEDMISTKKYKIKNFIIYRKEAK